MAEIFEKELATYNEKLSELQRDAGKFALIKGDKIEGIFDTYADALKVGYERFKLERFLVKQISTTEQILHFTRDLVSPCL